MILQSCTFVLAAAWAVAVWMTSYATTWHDKPQGKASAGLLAGITFVAAWAVLGFLASLLINVIDAIFVCVAMDREMGQVRPRPGEAGGSCPACGACPVGETCSTHRAATRTRIRRRHRPPPTQGCRG